MNKAEFLQTGGFPVDLDTLDFMQSSYTALQKMALALAGDKPCIVTGCVTTGPTVSEGWVIVEGELLPFATQTLGTNVKVIEDVEQLTFEDGNLKYSYKRRKVEFSLSGTIPWTDFVRLPVLAQSESKQRKSLENLITFLKISSPTKLEGLVFDVDADDYTHTAGMIAYNNTLYKVDVLAVPFTNPIPGDKPKFAIDASNVYEHKMILVASNNSDGLFEYDTLLPVRPTYSGFTFSAGWQNSGGLGTFGVLDKISNTVEFTFNLEIQTGGTITVTTLPAAIRPATSKRFIIADYNGSDGASPLLIVNISSAGVVTIAVQTSGAKPSNRSLLYTVNYTLN